MKTPKLVVLPIKEFEGLREAGKGLTESWVG